MPLRIISAYGNAQQDDLWQALQEKADEDQVKLPASVKEIMDTWTYKMGYPVVHVSRDYATGTALIIQVIHASSDPRITSSVKL